MRTLSKGNYRVVYDPAKGESMKYDCRIQKEPGWHIIPNQQGNGKRDK